jgi:inosose dehydratase
MAFELGNSPESWGVMGASDPQQVPWERCLDEIAESGFVWTELGPYGYFPTDPDRLGVELDSAG